VQTNAGLHQPHLRAYYAEQRCNMTIEKKILQTAYSHRKWREKRNFIKREALKDFEYRVSEQTAVAIPRQRVRSSHFL
jgi:hypothetical protein